MAESLHPDVDIVADINELITNYPPLVNDRHRLIAHVQNGAVTLTGHVKSPVNRRYLLNNLPAVAGVTTVNADALYDDESLRIQAGQAVPPGMFVAVEYGAVVVTGRVPDGTNIADVVKKIQQIPGVERVVIGTKK